MFFCVLGLNVHLCAQISELSYDGESVAQRQYDLLHSCVLGDVVVEASYAYGLMVVVVGGVGDVSVLQRVVGKDEGSLVHQGQDVLVSLHVRALVAVDEGHVEHYA